MRKHYRHLTTIDESRIRTAYAALKLPTPYRIAKFINDLSGSRLLPQTVRAFMLREGMPLPVSPWSKPPPQKPFRRRGKLCYPFTPEDDERLLKLWGEMKMPSEIAKAISTDEIKRTTEAVYQRLHVLRHRMDTTTGAAASSHRSVGVSGEAGAIPASPPMRESVR